MIRKLNINNLEEIARYVNDLSKFFEEKVVYNLKKVYRKYLNQFNQLESDFRKFNVKGDKEDKGFLYQELMNLEGKRYSLKQKLKCVDELQKKNKIEDKLLKLSIKVDYLRAIIVLYGKSGKKCKILIKELLEKES